MENTSESISMSNIHSDICNNSGGTDQKLKNEINQMISKRKQKHKKEIICDKNSDHSGDSDNDVSVEALEKIKNKTSSNVAKHLISNCKYSKDVEQDKKLAHIDKKYNKISQVTRDTRGDVLKILLILQKLIDDSRSQKQKITKLEIKIKELDEKLDNQLSSLNNSKNSTSGRFSHTSDHSDFHIHTSTEKDCRTGSFREYELKFDRFKQEVNTEIIKINNALFQANTNFDDQISSVKEQLALLFGMPKKGHSKCC